MAKLDKETMKKQHFWLLLIPLFIGLLLAWIGLFFGVSAAIEAKAEANDKERKGIEAAKAQPKAMLAKYDERKGELFKLRTERWREMWELQQAVYQWPESLGPDQIAKVKDLKFGAEIVDSSFLSVFRDHYAEEYKALAEKEAAPIQFAGGWHNVLRYVQRWVRNPDSEDVWLAIEDFWVEREIIRALADVNKEAGKFAEVKTGKNDPRQKTFANRTWEVSLQLVDKPRGPMLEGTVRNKTDRLQPFNVTNELVLNVWLSPDADAKPFRFPIEGASLEGGKTEKIKVLENKHTVLEGAAQGIYRVEQVYDVRTAPVKRIDNLKLGYLSARHSQAELQMTDFSTKAVEAAATDAGGAAGPGGPPGGTGGALGGPGGPRGGAGVGNLDMGGGGPGGGGATSTDVTFNQVPRRRYVHRTDQVRAMPIGLTVIADQAYVQDVLTAMANCRLRFQTVQSHLARFRGVLSYIPGASGTEVPPMTGGEPGEMRPEGAPPGAPGFLGGPRGGGGPGSSDGPPRGGSGAGPPPSVSGGGPLPGTSGVPGFPGLGGFPGFGGFPGMGGFGGLRNSSDDQVAGNLVEIGLYGITSLYEKFQPEGDKKEDGTAAAPTGPATGTPTTPTTPAGTDPAAPTATTDPKKE